MQTVGFKGYYVKYYQKTPLPLWERLGEGRATSVAQKTQSAR